MLRHYSDHNDDLEIETVEIEGKPVTVITIYRDLINQWFEECLDRVVIHVEEADNPKFL